MMTLILITVRLFVNKLFLNTHFLNTWFRALLYFIFVDYFVFWNEDRKCKEFESMYI